MARRSKKHRMKRQRSESQMIIELDDILRINRGALRELMIDVGAYFGGSLRELQHRDRSKYHRASERRLERRIDE